MWKPIESSDDLCATKDEPMGSGILYTHFTNTFFRAKTLKITT